MAAGERAVGVEKIRQATGTAESGKTDNEMQVATPKPDMLPFWGALVTRPYMRARAGLAAALWQVGQWEEAIWHLQELLRLNPNDNQGIRFTLLTWLVFMGEPEPVEALLQAFPDENSTAWLYSSALWLFRKGGASFEACQRLRQAWASNRHVPGYLLEQKRFNVDAMPGFYTPGSEEEAQDYALDAFNVWWQIPGARTWLAREVTRLSGPIHWHWRR